MTCLNLFLPSLPLYSFDNKCNRTASSPHSQREEKVNQSKTAPAAEKMYLGIIEEQKQEDKFNFICLCHLY